MNIGISYWGVCADFCAHRSIDVDTPDGHRYGRPMLIRELWARGHTVVALQPRQEPDRFGGMEYTDTFPKLDALFLEWRWQTYKGTPDVQRQRELVQRYKGVCPIVAFDTDLRMTEADEATVDIILDPSAAPKLLTKPRVYFPFWSDWRPMFEPKLPLPIYGYIGNRYDREDDFLRLFFEPACALRAAGVQTVMVGNWLQKSPEREDPATLLSRVRGVTFSPRLNFYESMRYQSQFIATAHATRQIYVEQKFTSPRHIEAAMCWCPAVEAAETVLTVQRLSLDARVQLVTEQIASLRASNRVQDVCNAAALLEVQCKR